MLLNPTFILVVSLIMMAVGAGFIYLIVRGRVSHRPQGAVEWTGAVLSVLLIACSGVLFALTLTRTGAKANSDPAQGGITEQAAENFRFRLVGDNQPKELEAYQDKVVLLNFWATWCAPCLDELPALSRLQETYGSEGLVVLTISDESRQVLRDFELSPPFQTVKAYLPDGTKLPTPFDRMKQARPSSFIIDREGTIREAVLGARDYAFFEQAVTPYL